jgi:hypothetical protein
MEGHELSQSVSSLQLVQAFQPVSFATSTLRCISRAFDLYNCQCISIKPGWVSLVLSSSSGGMALTYFACDIPYTVQASDSNPNIKEDWSLLLCSHFCSPDARCAFVLVFVGSVD